VVLPGTRATIADLAWLRGQGLDRAIVRHAEAGGSVLGICGGFQMLGRSIDDPDGVEGATANRVQGLGLLDVSTDFVSEKVLRLSSGEALGQPVTGYEIHHGRISRTEDEEFLGGARRGSVFGTMWHGSLESDSFREAFLCCVASQVGVERTGSGVSFEARREARLDLLGDLVETHLDVAALLDVMMHGSDRSWPVLAAGQVR